MSKATALVLSTVLGLLATVLLIVFVIRLANSSGGNKLGDETFTANASVVASQVSRNGPILFQDLLGRGKDIYVQHLGDDRKAGWLAFRATGAGVTDRRCTLTWDRATRTFRDTACGSGATFPEDGAGLEQFPAYVQGANKLVVDLRPGAVAPPTTAAPTTTTTGT